VAGIIPAIKANARIDEEIIIELSFESIFVFVKYSI
jgi:hypothetical protein